MIAELEPNERSSYILFFRISYLLFNKKAFFAPWPKMIKTGLQSGALFIKINLAYRLFNIEY